MVMRAATPPILAYGNSSILSANQHLSDDPGNHSIALFSERTAGTRAMCFYSPTQA